MSASGDLVSSEDLRVAASMTAMEAIPGAFGGDNASLKQISVEDSFEQRIHGSPTFTCNAASLCAGLCFERFVIARRLQS